MTRTLTQTELVTELRGRFGEDPMDWAFQCPSCKDIATGRDFSHALKDHPRTRPDGTAVTASDLLGQDCIGRLLGALATPPTHTRGCDWIAYGFLPGPWQIRMPDDRLVPSFPLAPEGDQG